MTSRIGIMGGMFDPVHNGHREVAIEALELLRLDQLRMVPCGIPNHREKALCTPTQRLEMLQLAMKDISRIVVDSRELDRFGISYSFDTLVSIQLETRPSELFFIMGVDAFNSLPHWHRWRELIELCNFAVFARPGSNINPESVIGVELRKRQVYSVEEFSGSEAGKIIIFQDYEIHASSTMVKQRLDNNQPLGDLLPPEVASYLSDHNLYLRTN